MIPNYMSADIAKCTIANFTSTKWSVKITTAFALLVWLWKRRFTINKSDIGFSTSPILNLNIMRLILWAAKFFKLQNV